MVAPEPGTGPVPIAGATMDALHLSPPDLDTPPAPERPSGGGSSWATGTTGGTIAVSGTGCEALSCRRWSVPGGLERPEVTSPETAAELLVPGLAGADRECCEVLLLDTKHRLLDRELVSIGSLDHTFMSPREVFRDALLANAAAVVLAHNHPSGDPTPSADDELVTRRLARAGELVGVEVLDHLVVAGDTWVSLARRGVL